MGNNIIELDLKKQMVKAIENNEFKDCPFCGCNNVSMWNEEFDNNKWFVLLCNNCFCQSPQGETIEETIKNWNKRS